MNKIVKYISVIACAVLCLGLTACYDDDFVFVGNGARVTVSATANYTDDEMRGILNETGGQGIGAFTLLVFDSNANNANLIYAEDMGTDLTTAVKTIYLPQTSGFSAGSQSYYAVLFGNVTLSQLNLSVNNSTLENLYSAAKSVSANDNNPTDKTAFTWSAYLNISKTTTSLNFNLKPNVAKVVFTVTNNSSETTQLVNVQVRNVMNKVRYAQNALTAASKFTKDDNTKGSPSVIDYNKEQINLSKGQSSSISWYVPANMCGSGTRTNGNVTLPSGTNPTFVEVTGVRGVDHLSTAYKIYLGTGATDYNAMTNFDVKSDNIYNISATINNDGLTFDVYNKPDKKNGTVAGIVKLPSNANCYMINPNFSKTANGYPIYELPIDRINECWGANGLIPDTSMDLLDGETWTMDVIWQDINECVIQFCDKNGNNVSDTYSGTGVTPAYFKICPSPVTSSHYGNILVGVKKTGSSDYLWSWHLWVTDYNPDVAAPYSSGTYIRESTGTTGINGSVQHWHHIQDFYWGTSKFVSGAIWDTGIYKNAWIMDRNLGAKSSKTWVDGVDTYGCYYQWGSKNPYPHASYKFIDSSGTTKTGAEKDGNTLKGLYTINGSTATTFTLDGSAQSTFRTVKEVTRKPNVLYAVNASELYVSTYAGKDNLWASPTSISNSGKSIFDPCPIGWTVPSYGAFDFLTYSPREKYNGSNITYLGWYGTVSSYSGIRATFTVWRESNLSLEFGQKDFAAATMVTSTSTAYHAIFPVQGVLSAHDEGISSNIKAMMWFAESSVIPNNVGNGEATAIFSYKGGTNTIGQNTDESGNTYRGIGANAVAIPQYIDEIYTGTLYGTWEGLRYEDVWNGRMTHNPYNKSRGQNVRCIQLPDKEIPKYYNN